MRRLYVGSLNSVSTDIFADDLDYVALGHLHVPQKLGKEETRRYSGSPLPVGFGEAGKTKSLCMVEFDEGRVSVNLLPVPVFQKLERIKGNWQEISFRIRELKKLKTEIWLEVTLVGDERIGDLRDRLESEVALSALKLLCVKDEWILNHHLNPTHADETLEEMNEWDVFKRRLAASTFSDAQRVELTRAYEEIIQSFHDDDLRAE
ncbi:MAG: exonuclease SbcCD subunit D C-terminal domain-containing protein [Magnetococcales bacterium]|nr:exonuclease SbcCD subunit D C-terminal domain-containing protein [Magnetococcales bacterium]